MGAAAVAPFLFDKAKNAFGKVGAPARKFHSRITGDMNPLSIRHRKICRCNARISPLCVTTDWSWN